MNNEVAVGGKIYKSLSYPEYTDRTKIKLLSTNVNNMTESERKLFDFTKLNLQRSLRIEKNYVTSEQIKTLVEAISTEQLWLVITEDWCGDSAQNVPYIFRIAELNPRINFRIILRDANLELMDQYLTNGTRSIPKLIIFDHQDNEILRWGPRPKAAQDLYSKLKDEGIPKPQIYESLHKWYTLDQGKELEKEFSAILPKLISS